MRFRFENDYGAMVCRRVAKRRLARVVRLASPVVFLLFSSTVLTAQQFTCDVPEGDTWRILLAENAESPNLRPRVDIDTKSDQDSELTRRGGVGIPEAEAKALLATGYGTDNTTTLGSVFFGRYLDGDAPGELTAECVNRKSAKDYNVLQVTRGTDLTVQSAGGEIVFSNGIVRIGDTGQVVPIIGFTGPVVNAGIMNTDHFGDHV